mgnify:CR=1 FL=1
MLGQSLARHSRRHELVSVCDTYSNVTSNDSAHLAVGTVPALLLGMTDRSHRDAILLLCREALRAGNLSEAYRLSELALRVTRSMPYARIS